jgi:hypothetical protein
MPERALCRLNFAESLLSKAAPDLAVHQRVLYWRLQTLQRS